MPVGRERDLASAALLLRPDGRIERLAAAPRSMAGVSYGEARPGRSDGRTLLVAARSDRRSRRRCGTRDDPGRIVDLVV